MYETPYVATHPLYASSAYSPLSIGAACPTRSYWWLALAAVAGGFAGWHYSKGQKKGRRR